MTAKMEIFTEVLKIEVAARRLLQSLQTFRRIIAIQESKGPEIINSPLFQDVGIAYIYQNTQRNSLEDLNL